MGGGEFPPNEALMISRIRLPFFCIVLSLLFQTGAVGCCKQAALTVHAFSLWAVFTNPFYVMSIIFLAAQAVTWQIALRAYPLSFAYFVKSGIFVNILLLSHFVFHETVSTGNMLGAGLIIAGILVLTRTNNGAQGNV